MIFNTETEVLKEARDLLAKSGFPLTPEELDSLQANDFGLGDLRKEGFQFIDILLSPRVRITLMAVLPNQTLPQHVHPPYDGEPGKEETIRVIYGQGRVGINGGKESPGILIPKGKEKYYTARQVITLEPGEQFTVEPTVVHWFQAGDEGMVCICFQNRVDEMKNRFFDPESTGCPIEPVE